jgi:hypothetical protein
MLSLMRCRALSAVLVCVVCGLLAVSSADAEPGWLAPASLARIHRWGGWVGWIGLVGCVVAVLVWRWSCVGRYRGFSDILVGASGGRWAALVVPGLAGSIGFSSVSAAGCQVGVGSARTRASALM